MKLRPVYIAALLFSVLLAPACKKVIEVEPEFSKDGSQIFTTLQDYEYALTGGYALFRATGYFGSGAQTTSTWANLPDMMGDNLVQTSEDLANWQNQTNWVYTTDENDLEVAWLAAYSVIAEANLVLRNIDQFGSKEGNRVNRIKGQALAMRGMAHFDVLRYWGVSFDRNATTLGIPYVDSVNIDIKPARLTVKESWDRILKDMTDAEALLGSVDKAVNTASNKSFLDQTAVRALLARMYLYAKDYVKAEQYASQVITAVPLASKTAFPEIWRDNSVAEVIWSVAFNAGEGSPSAGVHIASSNRNRYRGSTAVEGSYDPVNDIRFAAYFGSRQSGNVTPARPVLAYSGNTRKIVTKFMGKGTSLDNVVNWKALRTGEQYLIRAEARALQGGAKEAAGLADLNDLRAARINGYVPVVLSGQALLDAIALERRKELFGEGHRWFDLKRTTRTITRTDCGTTTRACTLAPTAREWVWPIPQGEIDANPNIKGQQSPNY